MFRAKTVFILGAGASCHYGYPSGEELVQRVHKKAMSAETHFRQASKNDYGMRYLPDFVSRTKSAPSHARPALEKDLLCTANECRDLATRLKAVDPLVIDYFIGHNRHIEDIAKLCIAWEILESESSIVAPQNNWCRFIIHKLVGGCVSETDMLANKVNFITFNYDVSLETQLQHGLSSLRLFAPLVKEFLSQDRIVHLYGQIPERREDELDRAGILNWHLVNSDRDYADAENSSGLWEHAQKVFDYAFDASKSIRTIAPDKAEITSHIEKARQLIAEAECVYILGYGFDATNNDLLDLSHVLQVTNAHKYVLFTNYGNRGIVNKNASRMFFGANPNRLTADGNIVESQQRFTCEKSVNKVYEALAYDFDAPEERSRKSP